MVTFGAGVVYENDLDEIWRGAIQGADRRPQQYGQVLVVERHDDAGRRQVLEVCLGAAAAGFNPGSIEVTHNS